MKGFSAEFALAVLLVGLLALKAECGTNFVLGGSYVGWTNTADIDYNNWLSDYRIKIGDTLIFVNNDNIPHSVTEVDKAAYDSCGSKGNVIDSSTIGTDIRYSITFYVSGPYYFICNVQSHCVQGMKVYVEVMNADGSLNKTAAAADSSTPTKNSAFATAVFSWTSQLLIATVAVLVAFIPTLAW